MWCCQQANPSFCLQSIATLEGSYPLCQPWVPAWPWPNNPKWALCDTACRWLVLEVRGVCWSWTSATTMASYLLPSSWGIAGIELELWRSTSLKTIHMHQIQYICNMLGKSCKTKFQHLHPGIQNGLLPQNAIFKVSRLRVLGTGCELFLRTKNPMIKNKL